MLGKIMEKKKKKTGVVPVYLNVYDLTPINGYAYWLGLGVYHSGLQVNGIEYAFGAHDLATTGVFEVEPRQCPGFTFRKSILMGRTDFGAKDVHTLLEKLSIEYSGSSYHLIRKNCNHFCNDLCVRLTGKPIPSWVNRLARLGILCKCVLPVTLDEIKVRQIKKSNKIRSESDTNKRSLRIRCNSSTTSTSSTLSTCSPTSSNKSRRQRRCIPPSSSIICDFTPKEAIS